MDKLKFALGDEVKLRLSGEPGTVKARAEYLDKPPGYLVLYKAADGRQVDGWWDESDLSPPSRASSVCVPRPTPTMGTTMQKGMIGLAVVCAVAAWVNYDRVRPTGSTVEKSEPFRKDQARLPRVGCVLGVRDWICEGE